MACVKENTPNLIVEKISHDYSYCVRSPCRFRRKIDDIVAKAEKNEKEIEDISAKSLQVESEGDQGRRM